MSRKCEGCDNEVTSKTKTVRFCSISCSKKNAPRKQKNGPLPAKRDERKCPACEGFFTTRWDRQECCSRSCARSLQAKKNGPGNWKGGRNKHASGYIKALAKGHPAADKNGYVMEHRLIMEQQIGRRLEPWERVHHKNGKRADNRPENLELWGVEGSNKKDPPGQRAKDMAREVLLALPQNDLHELLAEFYG